MSLRQEHLNFRELQKVLAKPRIASGGCPSDEEVRRDERLYVRRFQDGDIKAGELLLKAHRKLIEILTRRYTRGGPQEYPDRLQVAKLGFLEASARYDESYPVKLFTWAKSYVRHYVLRDYARSGTVVRFPVAKSERKYERRVFNFSELEPDEPEEDEDSLEESVPGECLDAESLLSEAEIESGMAEVVAKLTKGMSKPFLDVLHGRFHDDKTLLEIGDEMRLSRERIRQIQVEALRICLSRANRTHRAYGSFVDWLLVEIQNLTQPKEVAPVPAPPKEAMPPKGKRGPRVPKKPTRRGGRSGRYRIGGKGPWLYWAPKKKRSAKQDAKGRCKVCNTWRTKQPSGVCLLCQGDTAPAPQ